MGGNALKGKVETRRYQKDEFLVACQEVKEILGDFPVVEVIPYYKNKDSFGDMDVVIVTPDGCDSNTYLSDMLSRFGTKHFYKNGDVLSLNHKDLQVDLISAKRDNYLDFIRYFSYNDLGNIMGRLADSVGLRYGHLGMWIDYPFTIGKTKTALKVELGNESDKIFNILGLSRESFDKGFDELEDVFNYAVSSSLFRKDIFLIENLNHQNRTRNRKRTSYMKFLEYINDIPDSGREKVSKVEEALDLFGARDRLEAAKSLAIKQHEELTLLKTKVSFEMVKSILGGSDRDCGIVYGLVRKEMLESKSLLTITENCVKDLVLKHKV